VGPNHRHGGLPVPQASAGEATARTVEGAPAVVVEVPLEALPPGDYRVTLVTSEGGREETLASYAFRVLP
jgi:hypothetical protein